MKTALITGIAGQDGSYMAELLLAKRYRVIGAVRSLKEAHQSLPANIVNSVELTSWDVMDSLHIKETLLAYRPSEIYNYAALSSGARMFESAVEIGEVNGLAVTRILEAIREVDPTIRFCQASSSEMFGDAVECPQSEETPFRPRTPYGAAKLYAHSMVRIYRQRYGLFACSAILFNHESPRRGHEFVTRKITYGAASIKLGLADQLHLGNLDARRDWGFAGDYVRAMWLMLQQSDADDYLVATGESHSVRELCEHAFRRLGLDYLDYVREDTGNYRPTEMVQLLGNPQRARSRLGWFPEVRFSELIDMMVDADMLTISSDKGA